MNTLSSVDDITHVDQLLAYDGVEFIDMAYRVLLRRTADAQGRAHFIERLQNGDGKEAILHALFTSKENRRTNPEQALGGITALLKAWSDRKSKRLFARMQDLQSLERKINRLEFVLATRSGFAERHDQGTEAAAGRSEHPAVAAAANRSFETRRGRSALHTLLNFEASVRASPLSKAFAR